MPAVVAYHLILTAYGFWLPNDPRGSWSDFVRAWDLFQFGPATRTRQRRSLARDQHDVRQRLAAKQVLVRQPVSFDGTQARAVGRGLAAYVERSGCPVYACSILHGHAHLVTGRHRCSIEQVANLLKGAASAELAREGIHPFQDQPYRDQTLPTPWSRKYWKVFLSVDADVQRAIRYVENNPLKEGYRKQTWSFVRPFPD